MSTPQEPWEKAPPSPSSAQVKELTLGTKWREGERRFAYANQNPEPKKAEINLGTAAAPDEGAKPVIAVSRVLSVAEASFEGDGEGNLGAIRGTSVAVAASQGQAIGGAFSAVTFSSYSGVRSLADAVAVTATGISREGTRTGQGLFTNGRVETAEGRSTGNETVSENLGENDEYTGVLPRTKGIHLHGGGTKISGAGLVLGHTTTEWDTGIAAIPLSVKTAFIRDDSSAIRSIVIRGTHEKAAIAVKEGSGPVVLGIEEKNFVGSQLLELYYGENALDPGFVIGTGKGKSVSGILMRNSTGQAKIFAANTANAFLTGTAQGDTGINYTSGKVFHLGPQTGFSLFKMAESSVGIGIQAVPAGSGTGNLFLSNASVTPTANPTNGSVLYAVTGDIRTRSSGGAISSIGGSRGRTEIGALTESIEIEHELGVEPGSIQLTYEGAEVIFPVLQVTAKSATKFTVKRSISTKVGFINWRCWVL
jgi:hypothetical protein